MDRAEQHGQTGSIIAKEDIKGYAVIVYGIA